MTAPIGKTVYVLSGFTGPTGTFKQVNILSAFTGPTGTFPIWNQGTGASGPTGTFETVINIGPTGTKGEVKTVIIPGFSSGGAAGSVFNPANTSSSIVLSNSNATASTVIAGNHNAYGTKSASAGKLYLEYNTITQVGGAGCIGLAPGGEALDSNGGPFLGVQPGGTLTQGGGSMASGPAGHVVCMAIDFTAKTFWIRYDAGLWNNSGTANPATGIGGVSFNGLATPPFFPFLYLQNGGGATIATATFAQAIPAGFSAWG